MVFLFGTILFEKGAVSRLLRFSLFLGILLGLLLPAIIVKGNAANYSSSALKVGVSMHMLDAVQSSSTNPKLVKSITENEIGLRQISPGSKYWAIQSGVEQTYPSTRYANTDQVDAIWSITRETLFKFPGIYVSSVMQSFFSNFYGDVNSFRPPARFHFKALYYLDYLSGILLQSSLLLIGLFLSVPLAIRNRVNSDSQLIGFTAFLAVLATIFLNAIVSPVEQVRYLFPLIPSIILLCAFNLRAFNEQKNPS